MASEAKEGFFESWRGSPLFEAGWSAKRNQFAFVQDGNAVGEKLDFGQRVRCEKKCGRAVVENLRFEELPEGCRGEGVETAGGFVEKEDAR